MSNPSITYGIRWDYGLLSWQGLCLELRARKPQYLINDISVPLAEWMSTMRMHGLQAEALAALARMPDEIRPMLDGYFQGLEAQFERLSKRRLHEPAD